MHVRRPSPGTAIALLALFFAMGGTAIAAHHYLISSTKQFSPKVLKALKGKTGATGPAGPQGPKGETGTKGEGGAKGERGEPGPLLTTLPSGKSERGAYGFAGTVPEKAGYVPGTVTSYPIPVSFIPTINIIKAGGASTASCPGNFESPTAKAGNLCVYASREDVELSVENAPAEGHFGFFAFAKATPLQNYEEHGTWAVTAP